MIKDKKDLFSYLEADRLSLGRKQKKPKSNDYIWKYEILLRKCEYYQNTQHSIIGSFIYAFLRLKRSRLGVLCGFDIPVNVVDKGLCIAHPGSVIISEYAKIGRNCKIHAGVNIGADARKHDAAPNIGDEVYIGPGAKLFGDITIADRIAIGANAVVNKSFLSSNVSIGGVPAKVISNTGTEGILFDRKDA